jgi:hypothetical protein
MRRLQMLRTGQMDRRNDCNVFDDDPSIGGTFSSARFLLQAEAWRDDIESTFQARQCT